MKTMLVGAALASAMIAAPQSALAQTTPQTISSTFDTGVDGWRYRFLSGGADMPLSWDASSKLISSTSGFGPTGFVAPDAYLGDKSAYIGGTLSFDLSTSTQVTTERRSLIVLTYGNGKQIFADLGPHPTANLQTFTVQLTGSSFFDQSSGTPLDVSDTQFAQAMGDLRQLFILGDWTLNVDTSRLDNVFLAGPAASAVPEPATWAMMLLGFGAIGYQARRKKRILARVAA